MARTPQLCFLVGAPRSGTTWIQRLLQAHPAICGGEESHFFTLFGGPLHMGDVLKERPERQIGPLLYMERDEYEGAFRELWSRIFARLYAEHPQAAVHLEKTPDHTFSMAQVVRLFPDAKFVFLARDSRAVVASLLHAAGSWGGRWAPDTAGKAALLWYRSVKAMQTFHAQHPDHPLLVIRYEDAVADPKAVLDRLLRFVLPAGIDAETEAVLARFEASSRTQQDPQGFARLRGVDGWRNDLSLRQKLIVWRYTRKKMQELGYDVRSPF